MNLKPELLFFHLPPFFPLTEVLQRPASGVVTGPLLRALRVCPSHPDDEDRFPASTPQQLSYPSPCSRRRHSTRETRSVLNLLRGRSPLPQTSHFPRLSSWGTLSLPLPSPQAAVWAYVIGASRIKIPTPYESPISRRETNIFDSQEPQTLRRIARIVSPFAYVDPRRLVRLPL